MISFASIADFLLAKWLWNMTFDWYHFFINFILMTFLLKNIRQTGLVRASLFSFVLQIFAFGCLTLIVVGLIHYGLGWQYILPEVPILPHPNYVMRTCLWIGVIYSLFQSLFIVVWSNYIEPLHYTPYLIVIWMGNFVSAIVSYCCILFTSSLNL